MAIGVRSAASLSDLVDTLLDISTPLPADRFLWFRGMGCNRYELSPKIMREGKTAEEVLERELRLLTRFRQRSIPYWPSGYPQNDWEHLFAMQHYGFPTRLLDWTENAFVAAHFALQPHPADAGHDHTACQPALWVFDPVAWNRKVPPLSEFGEDTHVLTTVSEELEPYRPETDRKRYATPVALFGAHNSDRIVAQRGTFVVWGKDTRPLEDFANELGDGLLWRIDLEGDRADLASDLHRLGFSETMVFPELPSLAEELTRVEGWR